MQLSFTITPTDVKVTALEDALNIRFPSKDGFASISLSFSSLNSLVAFVNTLQFLLGSSLREILNQTGVYSGQNQMRDRKGGK